jgi:hypothetical protein
MKQRKWLHQICTEVEQRAVVRLLFTVAEIHTRLFAQYGGNAVLRGSASEWIDMFQKSRTV